MLARLLYFNRIFSWPVNGLLKKRVPVRIVPARRVVSRSDWLATWGISSLVHAFVFATLALITLSNPAAPESNPVLADFSVPETVVNLEPAIRPAADADVMRGLSAGGRPGEAGPVAGGIETGAEHPAPRVASPTTAGHPQLLPLEVDPRLPSKDDLGAFSLGTKLGKAFAKGGGVGHGVGDGEGDGSGSQFFHLTNAGTKFVFVIDGSGSMTEKDKEGRSKLDRVKVELINCIGNMNPEMEFYVIFFNQNAVPMKAKCLQRASGDNKQKYLQWVATVQGGGNTDPREALKLALSLEPEVIHLLTDGVFDKKVAAEVTKQNTHKVSIHTICFVNAAGESLLREIATRNNGTYRFIR